VQARIRKSLLWALVFVTKFVPLSEGVRLKRWHQRGVPHRKKRYLAPTGLPGVKTVVDRYRHATYHNKQCGHGFFSFINIDDLERH